MLQRGINFPKGGIFMLLQLLQMFFSNLFYFALHVTGGGSFPKPLSAEEERELVLKTEAGDEAARNKLVEHNLRLVAHIVKKYSASGADPDDLISIGTIGLMKAVSTFHSEKNIRLATYAARCIENEILMYFRSTKKSANDVLFSDPVDTDKDGNTLTFLDIVAEEDTIADDLDLKIKSEQLREYLKKLSPREQTVIFLRYGLGGREELTQREVAKRLGISRSYVSRIEKRALLELRRLFDGRA